MKRSVIAWIGLLAGTMFLGCASRGNVDVLESRLRQYQDELAHSRRQLDETRSELVVTQRETDALRQQIASNGGSPILPEQAQVLFRVAGIQFHKMLTGGFDEDQSPGDEQLSALLIPHDADGELLKVPAEVELELFDLTRPQGEQVIGHWKFDVAESQEHWYRGFIGSGFLFRIPWQQTPQASELLLHGRLITSDGRQFDTSQPIRVALATSDGHSIGASSQSRARGRMTSTQGDSSTNAQAEDRTASRLAAPPGSGPLEDTPVLRIPEGISPPMSRTEPELLPPVPPGRPLPTSEMSPFELGPPPLRNAESKPGESFRTSDVWTEEAIPRLR